MKTVNLNPAIAWKSGETLSLGAGVSVQYAEATLTNATNGAGLATVKGDDFGWGYNLGALWQLSKATHIGLAYRSEVEQDLGGDVGFSTAVVLNGPVNAALTLPDSAALSLFHKFDSRWALLADVTWTDWSDFKALRIVRVNGHVLGAPTEENRDNTYRYSLGANYHFRERLTLRSGVAFDPTPVSDAFRTARIPDEDRTWIAFGAQYRLSSKSAIDVGYAHLFVKDAAVEKTENGLTLMGRYDAAVDILSAQFTHGF